MTIKVASAKGKGRMAENAVAALMRDTYWPYAERRRMRGSKDCGDVLPHSGAKFIVEVKNAKNLAIPAWLRETEEERINAQADIGLLVVKPKGMGAAKTMFWHAIVPLDQYITYMNPTWSQPYVAAAWKSFDLEGWLRVSEEHHPDRPVAWRPRGWEPGKFYPVGMRLGHALDLLHKSGYGALNG